MNPIEILDQNKQKRLDELIEFLKFPSVSAKSEHDKDVLACADWLNNHFNNIGIKSKIMPTAGHPVVYGELISSPDKVTVMYYGHYDVQPDEPLELWKTEPFNPVVIDGNLCARGATDDKGQMFTHVKALEAYLASGKELPINVKLLIEGEEESGAENLANWVKENKDMLGADIIVVSDSSQFAPGKPAVTFGLRGVAFVEVKVTGPSRDLHSGGFGGAIANPINVLADIISSMKDSDGRITIDGFYDKVIELSDWEREKFGELPYDEKEFLELTGSRGIHGEKGYTVYEQRWARPTLDINGIKGGYQGEGGKTIIPSEALAKITMRLVPDQDAGEICNLLEKHVKKVCPDYIDCEVIIHGGGGAVVVPHEGPWLDAAARAIKTGFGTEPIFMKEGGSIPIVGTFKEVLGIDTLLLGWGQHDDGAHSPNEKFSVEDFERGTYSSLALIDEIAGVKK